MRWREACVTVDLHAVRGPRRDAAARTGARGLRRRSAQEIPLLSNSLHLCTRVHPQQFDVEQEEVRAEDGMHARGVSRQRLALQMREEEVSLGLLQISIELAR